MIVSLDIKAESEALSDSGLENKSTMKCKSLSLMKKLKPGNVIGIET
jgi:hypothetical protein